MVLLMSQSVKLNSRELDCSLNMPIPCWMCSKSVTTGSRDITPCTATVQYGMTKKHLRIQMNGSSSIATSWCMAQLTSITPHCDYTDI